MLGMQFCYYTVIHFFKETEEASNLIAYSFIAHLVVIIRLRECCEYSGLDLRFSVAFYEVDHNHNLLNDEIE